MDAPSAYHYFVQEEAQHLHEKVQIAPIPSWVVSVPVPTPSAPHPTQINEQYLLIDKQIDTLTQTKHYHFRIKLLTPKSVQEISNMEITFDPAYESIALHYFKVIRDGKEISKLDPDELRVIQRESSLQNHIYDGILTVLFFMDDIREGDELEYAYSRTGLPPVSQGLLADSFDLQWTDRVDKLFYKINKTAPLSLRHSLPLFSSCFKETERECTWELEPATEYEFEPYAPRGHVQKAFVEFSSFTSWNELAKTVSSLYKTPTTLQANLEVQQLISEWDTGTVEEKAERAVRFVQDEIRYLGIETGILSHQPTDPLTTFKKRYGDCKGKSHLLHSLLTSLDIPSKNVLVYTRHDDRPPQNGLPSPFSFNHAIVRIDLPQRSVYVDTTHKLQGGDIYHLAIPDYGYGLTVSPDTIELEPITFPMPDIDVEAHKSFLIREDNKVELKASLIFQGSEADAFRNGFRSLGAKEITKNLEAYVRERLGSVKTIDSLQVVDDREKNLSQYSITFLFDHPWDKTKSFFYLPTTQDSFLSQKFNTSRKSPLALPSLMHHKETLKIIGPHQAIPFTTIEDKAFTFSVQYTGDPSTEGELIYELTTHTTSVDPADLKTFAEHLTEAKESAKLKLFQPVRKEFSTDLLS